MPKLPKNPSITRSIFIDSSNIAEIEKWYSTGIIDGVTMNQAIMLQDGLKPQDFERTIKKICSIVYPKPVSVELTDSVASVRAMISEAKKINALANNIVIKVPLIPETTKSLEVVHALAKLDMAVNITTLMTFEQMVIAILAARQCKKLSFVSLFWGRSIEDQAQYRSRTDTIPGNIRVGFSDVVNVSPNRITEATANFLMDGKMDNPKIIVGSIRNARMIGEAFAAGAHIVTVVPDLLNAMLYSQRTIETIQQFDEAWQTILKS